MAIQKTPLNINFAQGLDTKTDPNQVTAGKFLALENSVFTTGGRLQKRNGNAALTPLPDTSSTYATTFNGNLTMIGTSFEALSQGSSSWVNKGSIQPLELETLSLIRSNTNQTQVDTAIAPNGFCCVVFTDSVPVAGTPTAKYKYAIVDSVTGQNIVAPTLIPGAAVTNSPRVFLLKNYFVIVFDNVIAAVNHLQYIAIAITNPTSVSANTDISTSYTPSTTGNFDGVVANNRLYLAWNGADGGGAIRMTFIDAALTQGATVTFATKVATLMSVSADTSGTTPIIYAAFYNLATTSGFFLAVNQQLTTVLAPTSWIATGTILNVTSAAIFNQINIIYETSNTYSYDSNIHTNFVSKKVYTVTGSVVSSAVVDRSIGLASKAFIKPNISFVGDIEVDNYSVYFLGIYSSTFQPSYFLIDSSGPVIAKLAYSNGGVYYTLGLPSVNFDGTTAKLGYFFKDLIIPVNKAQGAANAAGVYSQTGINLASFTIGTSKITSAEIGQDLHLTGGFLWMYDGYAPVEHGFNLWPDSVEIVGVNTTGTMTPQQYFYAATYEWTDNQGNVHRSAPSIPVTFTILNPVATFTALRTSGSPIVTSVSSETNLQVGQVVSGTGFIAGTYIVSIDSGTQLTLSNNASSGSGTSTTFTPSALGSLKINVPTLRLTYKTQNPVKIVVYRWSAAQQTYYQVTSLTNPTLNDTTVDSLAITDSLADSAIIGNSILYTTGGVVENIGAPSCSSLTLYKSRLFLIDSEDKNLLWYSKQVIEATPVEMSDLFTIYVAPTAGAQGSTGPMVCLSAMDDKLIIFKRDAIYYITGNGPDNTGANNDFSDPVFITSTVGSVNQKSIVFMPQGLMFQSDKGIWLLGRNLSTDYIGAAVEAFNSYSVESAQTIPGTNFVLFALSNGITLMYDYFYGQWGTYRGMSAISSTLYQNKYTYLNSAGDVFQESPGTYLDGTTPVVMSFTTSWFQLNGLQGFERAYFFYLLGEYLSPHRLSIGIAYDYDPNIEQVSYITPDNFNGTYGSGPIYGSNTYGGNATLEQWRVFLRQQKCEAFQLTISEIYDPTMGVAAGAGLTLSGLDILIGMKDSYPRLKAARSVG